MGDFLKRMRRVVTIASSALIALAAADGWCTVPEGCVGVMTVGRNVIATPLSEGFNLKLPVVATVENVHVGAEDQEVTPILIQSKELSSIEGTFKVNTTVSPTRVPELLETMGRDARRLVNVSCVNHAFVYMNGREEKEILDPEAYRKQIFDCALQWGVNVATVDVTFTKK